MFTYENSTCSLAKLNFGEQVLPLLKGDGIKAFVKANLINFESHKGKFVEYTLHLHAYEGSLRIKPAGHNNGDFSLAGLDDPSPFDTEAPSLPDGSQPKMWRFNMMEPFGVGGWQFLVCGGHYNDGDTIYAPFCWLLHLR